MSRKAGHGKQSESEQIMGQVWHGLVDTLRLLPTVPSKSSTSESIASETQTIDDALDKIALLISLRRGESVGPDKMASTGTSLHPHIPAGTGTGAGAAPSTPSASSTAGANGAAGGNKRKRRQSISISPAPPASIPSPTFAGVGIHSRIDRSSTPQINNNGPKGKKDVDQYLDYDHRQLPLQSGRKVAFKQPPAEGQREEDCEWILATVLRCLLGDKTRYTVKDDDDGKEYNTTLRSLLPLPDPKAKPAHPSHQSHYEEFPKHSIVLGLYPDTTSFYQATVMSTVKKGKYQLAFVDDGDHVHEVDASYVIKFPNPA